MHFPQKNTYLLPKSCSAMSEISQTIPILRGTRDTPKIRAMREKETQTQTQRVEVPPALRAGL